MSGRRGCSRPEAVISTFFAACAITLIIVAINPISIKSCEKREVPAIQREKRTANLDQLTKLGPTQFVDCQFKKLKWDTIATCFPDICFSQRNANAPQEFWSEALLFA